MNKFRTYISINEIGNRMTLSISIYINEIGNRITLKKIKVRHYLELLTLETRKLLASTKSKKTKMKMVKMFLIWKLLKYYSTLYPASTQRLEDVPLWSYFGRDVPDHFWTKIGRITYVTYFGTTMSDEHFESVKRGKIPQKRILWILIKLMSRGRPKNV